MKGQATLRGGRCTLRGSLGEGAQGHTFDGIDSRAGRPVAIKRFDVRTAKTWKDAELAERETRVLQSLSHPRLPQYVDHFEEDGALFLVMEKIDGESLAVLRKQGATLAQSDLVRLLRDASEVLDYLHGRAPPVIHRDLKPGNVIRRSDGSFAFVDFGAVRDTLRPEGGSTVVGTFGFMAPEQFQGRALPASDVYAIGATALAMLTGAEPSNLPHKGLAIDVRAALADASGPLDSRLIDVLERMLDPDPDRRPARIAPLLERLERVHSGGRSRESNGRESGESRTPFDRRAEKYEARAWDYERRAAAGGPGASGYLHGAEAWRKAARVWRASLDATLEKQRAKAERRAARRAPWRSPPDARHAERAWHPGWSERGFPLPARLFLAFGFAVGIVAVSLTMQVVVPGVLLFLSTFFARRELAAAAQTVREAGHGAVRAMDRSRRWFLNGAGGGEGRNDPGESPRHVGRGNERERAPSIVEASPVRLDDGAPGARVRIDSPSAARDGESDGDFDSDESAKRRSSQR
ncbi:MAG: serine/threonine protein kinase [Polyangiaceae bacterium]